MRGLPRSAPRWDCTAVTIVRAFLNVSLGRLWWTVGPASWTALLPVIGPVQRAGGRIAAAAGSGAAAVAVGAGTLLSAFAGTATAYDTGGGPAVTRSVLTGVDPGTSDPVQMEEHGPATDRDDDGERPTDGTGTVDPGGGNEEPTVDEPPDPDAGPVDGVLDDPGGAVGEVVDGTTDVLDDVVGAGTDALDPVTGGSSDAVDGVVEGVTDTVDDAIDDLTDLTGGVLGG